MTHHPEDPSRPYARRPEAPLPSDEEPEQAVAPVPTPAPAAAGPSRRRTPLETVLLASTAALLAAVAWPIATGGSGEAPSTPAPTTPASPSTPPPAVPQSLAPSSPLPSSTALAPQQSPPSAPAVVEGPSIQIALLLDTSSSMSGLIDQARSQLWSVVNALDSATLHGDQPTIEIALYEYGNSGLDGKGGFIRQVSPFTAELDRVAERLFTLETMGGSEFAGQVIERSIDELEWKGEGLKVIYIAGNEGFDQGPVAWTEAIDRARAQGVVVNTVNCTQGTPDGGWADAARRSGGRFLQIDHNAVAEHVATPQDEALADLGARLNDTYVAYGDQGGWGLGNQVAQDRNASKFGSASSVQRAITKSSRNYVNPSWDLLDALSSKTTTIDSIERSDLPSHLQDMSNEQLDDWVADKRKDRAEIKAKMAELVREREAYLADLRAEEAEGPERLDTAIVRTILEQARSAGFTIERSA